MTTVIVLLITGWTVHSLSKRSFWLKIFFFSRLAKEKQMYEKEVKDQSAKVEKMKADEKDEYDIKKQVCALFLQ